MLRTVSVNRNLKRWLSSFSWRGVDVIKLSQIFLSHWLRQAARHLNSLRTITIYLMTTFSNKGPNYRRTVMTATILVIAPEKEIKAPKTNWGGSCNPGRESAMNTHFLCTKSIVTIFTSFIKRSIQGAITDKARLRATSSLFRILGRIKSLYGRSNSVHVGTF